jgi:hypothetical protein
MNTTPVLTSGALLLGVLLAAGGCASVVHKVVDPAQDADETGIRYYQSAPYVLLYKDAKGAYVWKLYHLPDQTRLMVAEPRQFFSKIGAGLSFNNGVLTDASSEADATVVAKAIAKSIGTLAGAGVFDTNGKIIDGNGPWLWRVKVTGGNIQFLRVDENKNPETL